MKPEKSQPYPVDFRESSVKLAIKADHAINKTAKELELKSNTLHTWPLLDKVDMAEGDSRRLVLAIARCVMMCTLLGVATQLEAIIAAKLDDPPQYAAVVVMLMADSRQCSATKIAARRFLTAAHCVADTSTGMVASAVAAGRPIQMSNAVSPGLRDFALLHIDRVVLHPDFKRALERFHAYKEKIINEYREHHKGVDLELRIRRVESDNHFTVRNPDLAVVSVRELTPGIPITKIDFAPLTAGDLVHLIGYGCEADRDVPLATKYGRRRWGETKVIRIDTVNFYTFANQMLPGAPSLCSGDSGGPVMRAGKVVGVHGTVYGLSDKVGARSNMSVNLRTYEAWSMLR